MFAFVVLTCGLVVYSLILFRFFLITINDEKAAVTVLLTYDQINESL